MERNTKLATVEEMANFKRTLREQGPRTFHLLLSALAIWLFSVLVFLPIASSIGQNVELVIVLITLVAFTLIISRAVWGFKNIVAAFSVFPARKYFIKKGFSVETALGVAKLCLYIPCLVFFYLLYFPYLVLLHPAVNGLVLIFVIMVIFLISLEIVRLSKKEIVVWVYSN